VKVVVVMRAALWRASARLLSGPPRSPPPIPSSGDGAADPRDFLPVRPCMPVRPCTHLTRASVHTRGTFARAHARDPRLRTVIERLAIGAGVIGAAA
jgi:hypothetical protein